MHFLVPCLPVLLELFEVLSGAIRCDRMQNKLWGEIVTAYLNIIFLWSVDFVLVNVLFLTWGVDCSDVSLYILCLVSNPATFAVKI